LSTERATDAFDMLTMSIVNFTVTAILGAVLVFTWARERGSPFVGWWGLAQLVLTVGVLIATVASLMNDANLVTLGTASMIFSAGTGQRRRRLQCRCRLRSELAVPAGRRRALRGEERRAQPCRAYRPGGEPPGPRQGGVDFL
jgi:hypothetical protein